MFRQWFSRSRSLILTIAGGIVVAALVTAFAIFSTGYTAQQLNLNDSSVWVANGTQQAIGRANTLVHQLNSVVPTTGSDLDVLQDGTTVMLVDNSDSKLELVDPTTSTVTQTVPLPPNNPQVFLSADNVVILAATTGQLWITPIAQITNFNSQAAPTLSLGADAVASMDDAGVLSVYSPSAKHVVQIEPDNSDAVAASSTLALPKKDSLSVTSVSGHWAVLDATSERLYLPGTSVSLKGTVAANTPALQEASSTGDRFLVAGASGLVAIPLAGGTPSRLADGQSGIAARPLTSNGCDFAAWTGGQAWRICSGDPAGTNMALSSVTADMKLQLRYNGKRVVLNDSHSGKAWAVQSNGQLINNWNDLIKPKDQQQQQQQQNEDTPPQVDRQQVPPVAVNDDLGARPGRTSVLPVLLNDYDPNGDVIVITSDTGISPKLGHVDLINNRQQLQITLDSSASGTITFRYTISDGHGGTASATVTVTVKTPGQNGAPRQVRTSKTTVVSGGRVTTQILGDWEDPDGDPMYVTSATVAKPDAVTFTPDGTLVFLDGGTTTGVKTINVEVSDGKSESPGTLAVTVRAIGKVPIIADPFMQIATAGTPLTISPLDHVRGGSAPLRLNNVPARAGVTITPSYDAGTFQFESTAVGTHYLTYVVTDGTISTTGTVRVDVVAPPENNTKPITIPQTVFVRTLSSSSVDVADTDIDPSGGVLLVTAVDAPAQSTGISAEILEQRSVQVTLAKPLSGPVSLNYTVTNGLASATGTITVVEIPTPSHLQPPIANPDSVTVRAGAAIDIPVLDNDVDPDGEQLTLVSKLAENVPNNGGLLFVSGDVLRYLAPQRPGNYTAIYEVEGPDGQKARAQVKIAVRQVDVQSNNPPVPQTLTSRVLAGGSVTINVPLSGIDPDGDTVQLLGQETNPEKGTVTTDVAAHTITYTAGDYSSGTDSFTYGVIDALGARGTGTVRIGIAAKPGGAPNPVANLDAVTVRPGVTVSVQVLANDSDPDGSPLHVVSARPNDKVTKAKVVGNIVDVKPPDTAGTYGVIYYIANATGGQASAFIRVTVDPNAPLAVPVASDTVLTLNDIVDRTTLDVNVLANVFFADGPSSDLDLSVYPGYGATAQVTPSKRIKVTVTAHSQIIPFKVANPDDPSVYSYAFIWVPGTDDALPQLDRTAPALSVTSGQTLNIPLNEYVIAAQGKKVQLADTSTVTATHSNGSSLVVNSTTLQFTSAAQYFGPASISFQVTDGTSASDPNGRKSTLSLPITVLPKTNQPPVFLGGVIDFQPGSSVDVDLVKLTNYPYPADDNQLVYSLVGTLPQGFTTDLSGQHLTIAANANAVKGTSSTLSVGVKDASSTGTAGQIQLLVVPSTKPLAQPAPDTAVVQRGSSTTIDVLANDNATNPFPGQPLKVIAIRGLDGGSLPAGVSVTPSADDSVLNVSVSTTASPGNVSLQYEVEDATDDPSRYVWGNVTISIEDRPDPVTNVHVTSFGDKSLVVDWNPGSSNNSAITGYVVTESNPTGGGTISTQPCAGSICTVTTPGNGPSNSVHLSVVAKNAIGISDSTSDPTTIWSDIIPGAPTNLNAAPLNHGLDISWNAPPGNNGSAITSYVVSVDGTSPVTVPAGTTEVQVTDSGGIANGSSVNYTVSAHNSAFASLANWNSASGTGFPAGPPLYVVGNAPNAQTADNSGTSVTLSWSGAFNSNGASITDYRAVAFQAGNIAPACSQSAGQDAGNSTSTTFTGLTANTQYNFVVFAFNAMGCGTSDIVSLTPHPTPGNVTAIDSSGPSSNGTNTWDFRLDGVTLDDGSATNEFKYQLVGSGVDGTTYGPVSYSTFLTTTNASQYGQGIQVKVEACELYTDSTVCGSFSGPFDLGSPGVPVDNSAIPGLSFSHPDFNLLGPAVDGTWTWSSGIALEDYDKVTYDCGNGDGPQNLDPNNPGSCTAPETTDISRDFPNLTITITANGHDYVRTYDWHDYD